MVVPTRHGNSRAVPTPRANFSRHVAGSAPFVADTVGQSHSFDAPMNVHALRNMHGDHCSPCIFRAVRHDNQYCALPPCKTHDARTQKKPVRRPVKKGYAVPPLPAHACAVALWLCPRAAAFPSGCVVVAPLYSRCLDRNPISGPLSKDCRCIVCTYYFSLYNIHSTSVV